MEWNVEGVLSVILVGTGATLFLDVFAVLRARLLGQRSMNWAMVGRWLGHLARGEFVLNDPAQAAPVPAEKVLGWGFHYGVGIVLAAILTTFLGRTWLQHPQPAWVIGFGAATVILPMLTLQPGLGLGVAARRVPEPWKMRRQSLITHLVFGVGLYLSAVVLKGGF